MNRMRALLAAGGLTGVVLGTLLALGFGPDGLAAAIDRRAAASAVGTVVEGAAALPFDTAADSPGTIQEQNRRLKDALELMQAREAQYRKQIEQANQALGQVERAAATDAVSATSAYGDEDDEHDDDHGQGDDGQGDDDDGKRDNHDEHEAHDD